MQFFDTIYYAISLWPQNETILNSDQLHIMVIENVFFFFIKQEIPFDIFWTY